MNDLVIARKDLGLSLNELARQAGLRSRGHLSQIERGDAPASVLVALKLERLCQRPGLASSICPDVALVRAYDSGARHVLDPSSDGKVPLPEADGAEKSDANISRTEPVV